MSVVNRMANTIRAIHSHLSDSAMTLFQRSFPSNNGINVISAVDINSINGECDYQGDVTIV